MELLEDPTLLVERYAGPGVCHRGGKVAVPRARGDAHLARAGELDGVAHEIEQNLREALFVAEANRRRPVHGRRERELLVLGERLGDHAHRLDHALDGVFGHVEGELAEQFLRLLAVEAFLDELGVAQNWLRAGF
jgi:hypothetical protein